MRGPRYRLEGSGREGIDGIKVFRDEFCGAGTGRNTVSARAILFVEIWEGDRSRQCGAGTLPKVMRSMFEKCFDLYHCLLFGVYQNSAAKCFLKQSSASSRV